MISNFGFDVSSPKQMQTMKPQTIVCNIGNSTTRLKSTVLHREGRQDINIKPQYDNYVFTNGKALFVLAEARLLNMRLH